MVLILKSILAAENHAARERNEQRKCRGARQSYPMVVMKLVVNESSEKRRSKQLLPTPAQSRQRDDVTGPQHCLRRTLPDASLRHNRMAEETVLGQAFAHSGRERRATTTAAVSMRGKQCERKLTTVANEQKLDQEVVRRVTSRHDACEPSARTTHQLERMTREAIERVWWGFEPRCEMSGHSTVGWRSARGPDLKGNFLQGFPTEIGAGRCCWALSVARFLATRDWSTLWRGGCPKWRARQ